VNTFQEIGNLIYLKKFFLDKCFILKKISQEIGTSTKLEVSSSKKVLSSKEFHARNRKFNLLREFN